MDQIRTEHGLPQDLTLSLEHSCFRESCSERAVLPREHLINPLRGAILYFFPFFYSFGWYLGI